MGLVEELVAWAQAAHVASPLFATQLVIGPRFTAIGAAPLSGTLAPVAGGIVHNGAAETVAGFDATAATREIADAVLGRPLHELVAFLGAPNRPAQRLRAAAVWQPGRVESRVDVGAAALNAALNATLHAGGTNGNERTTGSPDATGSTGAPGSTTPDYRIGDENGVTLLLERVPEQRFAAVGHIPYGARVRAAAAESWVLDLEPEGDALPFSAAAEVLPRADVVGVGGTALVDGLLEDVLRLCRPDAYVLLLGPSTPLAPLLFARGVAALSGSVVAEPVAVLEQLKAPHEGPTPRLQGMRPLTLHRA